MNYLLDANTYIQAKNFYYRMSICPGFWEWLDLKLGAGQVGSVDMIYNELVGFGDELSEWVKDRKTLFVGVEDQATQAVFSEIADFVVNNRSSKEPHISSFLSMADPWLIAKAKILGAIVVTHEVLVPANSTKVKIPNVCKQFGVAYCNTFDLLETLDAKLILHHR